MTHSVYTSASTERAQTKTRIRGVLAALLVLALMLTLFGCGLLKDRSATTLTIDDAAQIDAEDLVKYEDLQELDIRKAVISADDYLALQNALPNCSIHWSVPIMDQRFDNQVTQLALPASTDAAALDLLRYFPNLTTIDALSCTCYDALMSKSLERQDITFTWQVQIGDVTLLNNNINIEQGATFAGSGALKIPDGSHMVADNQADINVLLQVQGAFRPGNFNGIGVLQQGHVLHGDDCP